MTVAPEAAPYSKQKKSNRKMLLRSFFVGLRSTERQAEFDTVLESFAPLLTRFQNTFASPGDRSSYFGQTTVLV